MRDDELNVKEHSGAVSIVENESLVSSPCAGRLRLYDHNVFVTRSVHEALIPHSTHCHFLAVLFNVLCYIL